MILDIKRIEAAVNQIAAEKKLDKHKIVEVIAAAIKTAYKKMAGSKEINVNVTIDLESESIDITVEKTIVETVEDPMVEISLADLAELGADTSEYKIGDVIELDVSDQIEEEGFGRIASQAAKQVIIQKIQDAEKEKIYDLFKDKEGTVVNLKVDLVEKNKVILDYNGNKVVLPKSEQVPTEKYVPGQRLAVYVGKVEADGLTGPRVVLTRKDKNFVAGLFALNVPELEDGTVEVVKIVRTPGFKTKMVVASEYEEVDPAGSLIGPKGIRVKTVVDELMGEKVDIINYTTDMKDLLRKALSPANVIEIRMDEEEKYAVCVISAADKLKAIGRGGANVNLASELTGYRISLEVKEEAPVAAVEE